MTTPPINATDDEIIDESIESDAEQAIPDIQRYKIGFFGADYPVDALHKRLRTASDIGEGDIYIPDFQRGFIWTKRQADRFIESLLLGLPVPGIFLSTERHTNRRLVIDGGQRLRTIKAFMDDDFRGRTYKLGKGIHEEFAGKGYRDLPQNDRRRFDDAIIHATIVRQESPEDGDRSLFYLFERLNTGGTPANPHEVRRSLWGGSLNDLVNLLSGYPDWRTIYGQPSLRLKDQELILRFFALYMDEARYGQTNERTMKDFLSSFMARNRNLDDVTATAWRKLFEDVTGLIARTLGHEAFRPTGRLNTAVFDSVMVGVAHMRDGRTELDDSSFRAAYDALLKDAAFGDATGTGTSQQRKVQSRLSLAREAFSRKPTV